MDININAEPDGVVAAIAAAGTVLGAIGGIGAWRAGSAAKEAANRSAKTAEDAERFRRWDRLTPNLSFTSVTWANSGKLVIRLDGPQALERLDRVTVTIRDDWQGREARTLAGGPTAEEIRNQIWGPFRFNPNTEGVAKPHGRRVVFPDGVDVGEDVVASLEGTPPPPWYQDRDRWDATYHGEPIRLTIECERERFDPWTIKAEVPVVDRPRT